MRNLNWNGPFDQEYNFKVEPWITKARQDFLKEFPMLFDKDYFAVMQIEPEPESSKLPFFTGLL